MAELYDEKHMHASGVYKKLTEKQQEPYKQWHREVFAETTLTKKVKELIALGVGCALQCKYCMDSHAKKAKAFGATEQEIAEVISIAAAVRAGATISYGMQAIESYEE